MENLKQINERLKTYTCTQIATRERVSRNLGINSTHPLLDEQNDALNEANQLLCVTINGKVIPVPKNELEQVRERLTYLIWGFKHPNRKDI